MGFTLYPANNPNTGTGWTGTKIGSKTAMDVNDLSGAASSSSSAAIGSDGVYLAKPAGANGDAVSAFATATTLTVTGLPFTFAATDIVSIRQVPNAGGENIQDTLFTDVADFSVSGTTITVANAAFVATDVFIVGFTNGIRSYDSSTDSKKGFEVSPIWNQHVEETIVDVTNETDGTNNYFVDMDGYNSLNLQLVISGGSGTMTVTIEASAQDDGTAAASVTYVDVTNDVFGSASFTASTFLLDDQKVLGGAKFVKIKTVSSTGGANDADITVYAKKLY